jgi:hypothetical protein
VSKRQKKKASQVRRFSEIVGSDEPPTPEEIRKILEDTYNIQIGEQHSEERATQRGITDPEVYRVIDTGKIAGVHKNARGNWQFNLDADVAGRSLRIGISLDAEKARPIVNTRIDRTRRHGKA